MSEPMRAEPNLGSFGETCFRQPTPREVFRLYGGLYTGLCHPSYLSLESWRHWAVLREYEEFRYGHRADKTAAPAWANEDVVLRGRSVTRHSR